MKFGKWDDDREFVDIEDYRFPINNNKIYKGYNYKLNPKIVVIFDKKAEGRRKVHPIQVADYDSERFLLKEL